MNKTKLIEEKAYFKWLNAGKPEGRDVEFWVEAENEVKNKKSRFSKITFPDKFKIESVNFPEVVID